VIGAHYPRVEDRITTTDAARKTGKPLWSSEDQPNGGGGPFVSREWAVGGRILAHLYNQNYLEGSLTATEIWSPITSYYDNLAAPNSGLMYANTPWSGHYTTCRERFGLRLTLRSLRSRAGSISTPHRVSSGKGELCGSSLPRQEELERDSGDD
jgi:hypothetical protein